MLNLTFKEFKELEPYFSKIDLNELKKINEKLSLLNESEDPEILDEGLIKTIIGAVGGFVVGPTIGRIIAKVLGVEHGLLYNFLTSNFVNAALGMAMMKEKKK